MINRILTKNKKAFDGYNAFRKKVFADLTPQESEVVLYMIPWLLSVNYPTCPGYIPELEKGFRVFGIDNDPGIRKREPSFLREFGVKNVQSLLRLRTPHHLIQGLYTIGSIGTVSQTSNSDCDIWVCYDKQGFDQTGWSQLNQKINLLKDWLDLNLKIPVFFFITEKNDIKNSRFGSVDAESSGSVQKDVLKEEFYRTCTVICGKIPLWWVCYDTKSRVEVDYAKARSATEVPNNYLDDFIDFGNLQRVDRSEHFGAALWQLHKSLSGPLKSIVKMTLLKMQLDFPDEPLVCHQLREAVLTKEDGGSEFPDPMVFTMLSILKSYNEKQDEDWIDFLKRCFYLRCELKPYDKRQSRKKQLALELFTEFPIEIKERTRLSKFSSWDFIHQIELGNQLFRFLIKIYKEISSNHTPIANEIDKQDLKVLGRKILVSYQYKPTKISILHKPTYTLNLSDLLICLDGDRWTVFLGKDKSSLLISSKDIIYNISFMVCNDIFETGRIYMEPNPSSLTLGEIINLGTKIKTFLGKSNVSEIEFNNFLHKEKIKKLLIIVSFEKSPWEKDINDFAIVYKNSWGELFVKRFHSISKLEAFIKHVGKDTDHIETSYYVQRNCTSYEKIIERTKKVLSTLT